MFSDAKSKLLKWRRKEPPSLNAESPKTVEEISERVDCILKTLLSAQRENVNMRELLEESVDLNGNKENTCKVQQKIDFISTGIGTIQRGIEEAKEFLVFTNAVENLQDKTGAAEAEYRSLKETIKKLKAENDALRKELSSSNRKLIDVSGRMECLQIELEHLQFMRSLDEIPEPSIESIIPAKLDNPGDLNFIDEHNTESKGCFPKLPFLIENVRDINPRLRTFHNLVMNYVDRGLYSVAEPLIKTSLKDMVDKHGTNHRDVIDIMEILGFVYRHQNLNNEALEIELQVLDLKKEVLGEDNASVIASLNKVAVLSGRCGRCIEAEKLCLESLKRRKKVLAKDHPDIGKELCNLAAICSKQKKYKEADVYLRDALKIFQASHTDYTVIRKTQAQLATLYLAMERYSEAEYLCKDILTSAYEKEIDDNEESLPSWDLTQPITGNKNPWETISSIANSEVSSALLKLFEIYTRLQRKKEANKISTYAKNSLKKLCDTRKHILQ